MTDIQLPDRVTQITLADNRQVFLVGTAHVSRESVEDVKQAVDMVSPDRICVELCKPRYQTLTQRDAWKKMDIFKVVREKKSLMLLVQLIMSAFYRQLGKTLDVQPGAEMLEGVNLAKKKDLDEIVEDSLNGAALWNEVKDKLQEPAQELNPGQQQRLCIARAIAVKPEVILMDEPCSALDPVATLAVEELMMNLAKFYTIVIVTHNMQQAARVSDITGFFWLGRLVECDDTSELFMNPKESLTEAYLTGRQG